ncbi:HEAT repeat domain-containing protein [Candidatus Methylomirabilis sp.]|jgi:hypothetical protein|uniref:HEAT repeat domain-containing protein n=1 Tax=Candidatus Methylomirabilis sp. TaxID=2032687 RepID=UPI003C77524F
MRLDTLFLVGLLLSLTADPDCALAVDEPKDKDPFVVKVDRDRLTVRFQRVPLEAALKAIARKSGTALILEAPLEDVVTITFDNLPLDEGLRRLLGNRSYGLFYDEGRSGHGAVLKRVMVLTKEHGEGRMRADREEEFHQWRQVALEDSDPARRKEAVEILAGEELGQSLDIFIKVMKQDGDGDVREAALDAVEGLDTILFEPLFEVALQAREPSSRRRVLKLLSERGKDDPRIQDVLLRAATADADEEVRTTALGLLESFETEKK